MIKMHLQRLLAFSFALLILTACGRTAKTENWQIKVTDVVRVETEEEVNQLLISKGYQQLGSMAETGPYIAISVELKNISNRTMDYPGYFGTFNAFVSDSEGNSYHWANWGYGVETNWKVGGLLTREPYSVFPDKTIDDLYVFAIPYSASGLVLRLSESYNGIEASIKLGE